MVSKYIIYAFRLLVRNSFFTSINIIGLAVGFAVFVVLWPYSQSQLRSDLFHKDADRIVRLAKSIEGTAPGSGPFHVNVPTQLSSATKQIAKEFSEIETLTRIVHQSDFLATKTYADKDIFFSVYSGTEKRNFREDKTAIVDSNFFEFFNFPLIAGDAKTVLSTPYTVALSESVARKYFGDEDPIEKTVFLYDSVAFKVSGIFKDLPDNTHVVMDIAMSGSGVRAMDNPGWENSIHSYCYVKINKDVNLKLLQSEINKNVDRYYGCTQCNGSKNKQSFYLQDIHGIVFDVMPANAFKSKSELFLVMLSVVSIVILGLAWVNYLSLSVNMLHSRFHEIGTRKVTGASRCDFILQFLIEAMLINGFAFALAITIVQLFKNPTQTLFQFHVVDWKDISTETIVIILATILLSICITGLYPWFISEGRKPVELLKKFSLPNRPRWIEVFVTLQYAIATALLIWIGAIYLQLDFLLTKKIGLKKDGILMIQAPLDQRLDVGNRLSYFKKQALLIPGIQHVSVSKSVVGDFAGYGIAVKRTSEGNQFGLNTNGGVDEDFVPLYDIKIIAGRNFIGDHPSDNDAIMLSKGAAERLGFGSPQAALGDKVLLPWHQKQAQVIGIYEDYFFRPFFIDGHNAAAKGPESFLTYKNSLIHDFYPAKISVSMSLEQTQVTIDQLNKVFNNIFPEETFHWNFLEENINRHYKGETISRNQIVLFSILAVGIACLGLLGTVVNKAGEKSKEIGIRKILGARILHISTLLVNTSLKQILISCLISIPLAYYLTQQYLQKFSERITLEWWHYVCPICILFVILLATVTSTIIKTASRNPVDALQIER